MMTNNHLMKVLILIHEYPPIGGGGGHVAQEIARGLVKRGHEVTVLVPFMKGLARHTFDEGVRLIRIPSFRRKSFVGDLLAMSGYLLAGFFAGLWLILRFKPQVIHVHFAVPAGILAWMLSKLTGIPYVLTSHLGDVPGGVPEKTDRWFKWIYPLTPRIWRDAVAVTAISDFTRRLALSHYPVDIKVIPNGTELEKSKNTIEINSPPQIVFAGRFVSQKNPMIIPEILNRLRDLDWHCVMIGDGQLWKETIQRIELLDLKDRFVVPGWTAPNDVRTILLRSDILFLPSLTEGIPHTGLQALSCGLAIITSRVGGMPELVHQGRNGYMHDLNDIEGFQESLRVLLTDMNMLRNTRLASLQIAKRFDIELIVKKYESILLDGMKRL